MTTVRELITQLENFGSDDAEVFTPGPCADLRVGVGYTSAYPETPICLISAQELPGVPLVEARP